MIRYNDSEVIGKLNELMPQARIAFAAACAQRLLPAYVSFSRQAKRGDPDALAEILNRVWLDLLGARRMEASERNAAVDRSTELIPGEDEEPYVEEQPYGDDAAAAVSFAVRAMECADAQEAEWAARRAYDTLDHYVTHRLGVDDEDMIVAHPLIQAEFARQERDLLELRSFCPTNSEVILRLRERAKLEAARFFSA